MSGQKFLAYIGILMIEKIKNRNDGTVMFRSTLVIDIFQQIGNMGIFQYLVARDDDTKFFFALETATFKRSGLSANDESGFRPVSK